MGTILIKLFPNKLNNPDLDLRYIIPDRIAEITNGNVKDDGYDYLDEHSLGIFLKSDNPKEDVKNVLEILKTEMFLENDIYETGIVAICDHDDSNLDEYTVVHPQKTNGDSKDE